MRTDVVKMYKDIHTWVGIFSGLCLFIAFYAGAITMFEIPVQRWASAPSTLPPPVALADTPRLIEATIKANPKAAESYTVVIDPAPETPARLTWQVRGKTRGDAASFSSALDANGEAVIVKDEPAPVAQLIDVLHQQVGLPFEHEISMLFMGAVSLLYAVALVSGVIILLPSLVKDLFILRVTKNMKRMWLDVHNALGVFSLPFHIVMALTAVIFAFHDQIYDAQDKILYEGGLEAQWAQNVPRNDPAPPGARVLPPVEVLKRIAQQAPGFKVTSLTYAKSKTGGVNVRASGQDLRYGMRGPTFGFATVDGHSGRIINGDYLPGHQSGWMAAVTGFFTLHFGSFGGNPVRWGYFALGLAGAFLFYSGNLLWVESRRKRLKRGTTETVFQRRSSIVLGALTVGVSLGCVAGISATLAAAKWLPGLVGDLKAWHTGIYYTVFLAAVGWALVRGAGRGAVELLYACAAATALIPLTSLIGAVGLASQVWNHEGAAVLVDITAAAGAATFLVLARMTRRRVLLGAPDSIWSAAKGAEARDAAAA